MRLCDRDIYQHLQDGKIKIDPTPSYDQISGVTVDIRLGNKFRVFEDHQAPFIDLSGPKAQVQEALQSMFQNRTSLVIAHRLSTITRADNILVVDEGRIVESGTHRELIEKAGIYSRLFEAQVSGFIDWNQVMETQSEGAGHG